MGTRNAENPRSLMHWSRRKPGALWVLWDMVTLWRDLAPYESFWNPNRWSCIFSSTGSCSLSQPLEQGAVPSEDRLLAELSHHCDRCAFLWAVPDFIRLLAEPCWYWPQPIRIWLSSHTAGWWCATKPYRALSRSSASTKAIPGRPESRALTTAITLS